MTMINTKSALTLILPCLLLIVSMSPLTRAMRLARDTSLLAHQKSPAEGDSAALDEDRRATWLSTRQMEDDFKELVFLAVQELSNEGRLDPAIVRERPKTKRGRWQGFCFQRTSSGRFLPYICWKGDR